MHNPNFSENDYMKLETMKEHASDLIVARFSLLDDILSEYYICKDTKNRERQTLQ